MNFCFLALTLLRSFAVTLSSSRHGIRWTKANIWYLAFMNSVLLGLNRHRLRESESRHFKKFSNIYRLNLSDFLKAQQCFKVHTFKLDQRFFSHGQKRLLEESYIVR